MELKHTALPDSWLIPLAGPANRQGPVAAENICGRDTTFGSVQGTSVVKVFQMVAGGTGASEKQVSRAGVAYLTVSTHPHRHAGYYPNAAMMHAKVLFAPTDGKLLGAALQIAEAASDVVASDGAHCGSQGGFSHCDMACSTNRCVGGGRRCGMASRPEQREESHSRGRGPQHG